MTFKDVAMTQPYTGKKDAFDFGVHLEVDPSSEILFKHNGINYRLVFNNPELTLIKESGT